MIEREREGGREGEGVRDRERERESNRKCLMFMRSILEFVRGRCYSLSKQFTTEPLTFLAFLLSQAPVKAINLQSSNF